MTVKEEINFHKTFFLSNFRMEQLSQSICSQQAFQSSVTFAGKVRAYLSGAP